MSPCLCCCSLVLCVPKTGYKVDAVRVIIFVSAPSPFKAPSQSKVPVRTLLQFKQTYLYFHKISQLTASNLLALISSDMLVSFPNHQCKIKIIYMHVVLL